MYAEFKLQELQGKLEEYEKIISDLKEKVAALESKLEETKRNTRKSDCETSNTSLSELDFWIAERHSRRANLKSNNINKHYYKYIFYNIKH